MHNFKKGDLVRHKPSGCVGVCSRDYRYMFVDVKIINCDRVIQWDINDIEPYRDPTPVIEAARMAKARRFYHDNDGNKIEAVLPISDYRAINEALSDYDAYDATEPTCEGCEYYEDRYGATFCWKTMRFDPISGMAGCVFTKKED